MERSRTNSLRKNDYIWNEAEREYKVNVQERHCLRQYNISPHACITCTFQSHNIRKLVNGTALIDLNAEVTKVSLGSLILYASGFYCKSSCFQQNFRNMERSRTNSLRKNDYIWNEAEREYKVNVQERHCLRQYNISPHACITCTFQSHNIRKLVNGTALIDLNAEVTKVSLGSLILYASGFYCKSSCFQQNFRNMERSRTNSLRKNDYIWNEAEREYKVNVQERHCLRQYNISPHACITCTFQSHNIRKLVNGTALIDLNAEVTKVSLGSLILYASGFYCKSSCFQQNFRNYQSKNLAAAPHNHSYQYVTTTIGNMLNLYKVLGHGEIVWPPNI